MSSVISASVVNKHGKILMAR